MKNSNEMRCGLDMLNCNVSEVNDSCDNNKSVAVANPVNSVCEYSTDNCVSGNKFTYDLSNELTDSCYHDDLEWDVSDELNTSYLFSPDKYLFSKEFEDFLDYGYKTENRKFKHPKFSFIGLHVVGFRVIKDKNKDVLVYNSIYYDSYFTACMIDFLCFKHKINEKRYFNGFNNNLFLVDFFTRDEHSSESENTVNEFLIKEWELYIIKNPEVNIYSFFNYMCVKTNILVSDIDKMCDLIELASKRLVGTFLRKLTFNSLGYLKPSLYEEFENKHYNILNRCIFITKDLNLLLSTLKSRNKDLIINAGPQSSRGFLNSLTSSLALFDSDFRYALYTHNNFHANQQLDYIIPNQTKKVKKLGVNKFSFNNIHMNLGNVRFYSIQRSLSLNYGPMWDNRVLKNRQQLFQNNYSIVGDILEDNYHMGSTEVQEKVEIALRTQENIFSNNNLVKTKLNFNEESFEFIDNKHKELCRLLSVWIKKPVEHEINTKFHSTRFIPLVVTIIIELGIDKVSNILLGYFMEILTKDTMTVDENETPGISTLSAYENVGKNIYEKFIYSKYMNYQLTDKDIKTYKKYDGTLNEFKLNNKYEYIDLYDEEGFYAMVGGYFVYNLSILKLISEFKDRHPDDPKITVNYLRIVQVVREMLIKNNVKVYHLPQKLPMICEPKDYVYSSDSKENKLGGYLLNDVYYTDYIIKNRVGTGEKTTLKDGNIIVSLVNGLSKTPYRVNVETLEFIYEYGIDKNIIIDDSSKDIQSFISNPYKGFNKMDSLRYRSIISKILMERNVLSIADTFSKVEKIYFPVRLDFRTRIYCRTDYFDYQKSDLAKGLISFVKPGVISKYDSEYIKYFKAYGANMYGHNLDKKSLNSRVKWLDDNSDKILNFKNNNILDDVENKVCFISFCFEYIRFIKFMNDKEASLFYTYLPIQLDATCNGYQHLALLTKETKLFSKLNLSSSTHDDEPDDFYTYLEGMNKEYISSEITRLSILKNNIKKDLRELESLKKLKHLGFGRSLVKKIIMRESYSAGLPRLVKEIINDPNITEHTVGLEKYYTYVSSDIKLSRYDIAIFVKSIKRVAALVAPKVRDLSKYLQAVVNICTRLSIPIPWALPSGAEIPQSYLVEKDRKIVAFTFTRSKYTFKKYLSGKYDLKKQSRAIRPNLIHSLDATTIAMLYNSLDHIDLYTVHDCFAVTANYVPLLIYKLKMTYIKLYSSSSYLLEFDNMLRITLSSTLGKKIFSQNDRYINIPNGNKYKKIAFPDVHKIIKLGENISLEEIKEASQPII